MALLSANVRSMDVYHGPRPVAESSHIIAYKSAMMDARQGDVTCVKLGGAQDEQPRRLFSIAFSVLGPEDIRRLSVMRVTQFKFYVDNTRIPLKDGLLDPRFGTNGRSGRCGHCWCKGFDCPGHFGHIELAEPIYNRYHLPRVVSILRMFCCYCHGPRFNVPTAEMMSSVPHVSLFKAAVADSKRPEFKTCPRCHRQQPKLKLNNEYTGILLIVPAPSGAAPATGEMPMEARASGSRAVVQEDPEDEDDEDDDQAAQNDQADPDDDDEDEDDAGDGYDTDTVDVTKSNEYYDDSDATIKMSSLGDATDELDDECINDDDRGAHNDGDDARRTLRRRSVPDAHQVTHDHREPRNRRRRASLAVCVPEPRQEDLVCGTAGHDGISLDECTRNNLGVPELRARDALRMLQSIDRSYYPCIGWKDLGVQNLGDFIIQAILVPPLHVRPSVFTNGRRMENFMTMGLSRIVKHDLSIRTFINKGFSHITYAETTRSMQIEYDMYINQKNRPKKLSKFKYGNRGPKSSSIDERLSGKTGRFRGFLNSVRVNQSARSNIVPVPNIRLNEVLVSQRIALEVTYREMVTDINLEDLKARVMRGPRVLDGANAVQDENGNVQKLRRDHMLMTIVDSVRPGWRVHRYLKDGDLVLLGRAPSLHRMSMNAHYVVVSRDPEFMALGLNYGVNPPYNADFDGDTMMMKVVENEETRAEALTLMLIGGEHNWISPGTNLCPFYYTQDVMLAMWMLTDKDTFLVEDDARTLSRLATGRDVPLPQPAILRPRALWTGKQMFSLLLPQGPGKPMAPLKTDATSHGATFGTEGFFHTRNLPLGRAEGGAGDDRHMLDTYEAMKIVTSRYGPPLDDAVIQGIMSKLSDSTAPQQGRGIRVDDVFCAWRNRVGVERFRELYGGFLTRREFDARVESIRALWFHDDASCLLIRNGELLVGRITREEIASSYRSLQYTIWYFYGGRHAVDFVTHLANVGDAFLKTQGFSFGIKDVMPTVRDVAYSYWATERSLRQLEQDSSSKLEGMSESTVENYVSTAIKNIPPMTQVNLPSDVACRQNYVMKMATSGAKGNPADHIKQTYSGGPQFVDGRRMNFGNMRSRVISAFHHGDESYHARGYVVRPYGVGLSPVESHLCAIVGRASLIDSAVKTSESGYTSRKMMAFMKDLVVHSDHTVRNAYNEIIMFRYGGDNNDPTECTKVKLSLFGMEREAMLRAISWSYDQLSRSSDDGMRDDVIPLSGDTVVPYDALPEYLRRERGDITRLWKRYYDEENDPHGSMVPMPFDFGVILPMICGTVPRNRERTVTPREACEIVGDMVKTLRGIFYKSAHHIIAYIYENLCSRRCCHDLGLTMRQLHATLDHIHERWLRATVATGDPVGTLAAQSLGEPFSQQMLKSRHTAGSIDNITCGLPRIQKILSAAKKTPVVLTSIQFDQRRIDPARITATLVTCRLSDILLSYAIVGADEMESEAEALMVDEAREFSGAEHRPVLDATSPYSIRLRLNAREMHRRSMGCIWLGERMEHNIRHSTELLSDAVPPGRKRTNRVALKKPERASIAATLGLCCTPSGDDMTCDEVIFRLLLRDPVADCESIAKPSAASTAKAEAKRRQHVDALLKFMTSAAFVISDMSSVTRVHKIEQNKCNSHATRERYGGLVHIEGGRFKDTLRLRNVSKRRIYTNDIPEIHRVFGIGAARRAIFDEFQLATGMKSSHTDKRHLAMLVCAMTRTGTIVPVNRSGIKANSRSLLHICSFETPLQAMAEGSANRCVDMLMGPNECHMTGQRIPLGTGCPHMTIHVDPTYLRDHVEARRDVRPDGVTGVDASMWERLERYDKDVMLSAGSVGGQRIDNGIWRHQSSSHVPYDPHNPRMDYVPPPLGRACDGRMATMPAVALPYAHIDPALIPPNERLKAIMQSVAEHSMRHETMFEDHARRSNGASSWCGTGVETSDASRAGMRNQAGDRHRMTHSSPSVPVISDHEISRLRKRSAAAAVSSTVLGAAGMPAVYQDETGAAAVTVMTRQHHSSATGSLSLPIMDHPSRFIHTANTTGSVPMAHGIGGRVQLVRRFNRDMDIIPNYVPPTIDGT